MYLLESVLIGMSLSIDAFAICLCQGLTENNNKFKLGLKLGIIFGGFQILMPLLGYSLVNILSYKLSTYGNILASIILCGMGINMLKEGDENKEKIYLNIKKLLSLGFLTSIDSLIIGVSYAFRGEEKIYIISLIIGIVTFIISNLGVILGGKLENSLENKANIFAGLVFIVLGLKNLIGNFI